MSNVFPVPSNEHERLLALDRYAILDTEPEAEYNRIVELVRTVFDVPIALISIVGAETQQFKARCGLGVRGTGRDIAFCAHAILEAEPTIIEDASADPRFMDNPLVTGEPFIRFYAGVPLISPEGYALGTLCVCDSRPRTLTPAQVVTLREFAELVNHELARRRDRVQHGDKVHALYEDPRVILDGMSDAFFVLDRDFRFRHVNAQAEKLLKLDRGALEGKSIWSTFPELIQSVLHDKLVKAHAEHLDLEFEQFFETWHVWLRVRILSVENELSVFLSEITNQVKKSQALRDSEALKSAILDAAFDCIITIDEEARIIEFNTAAERTFGFSRHEVLGRVLTDLIIPHHFRDAHTRGMEHYMRTGEGPVLGRRIEISALRHDNTEFPVELAISPILLENNRRLFTAYLRDITQRKEAEQALREALDKERKLGEMKSRFVAQASHEFRTPLSMIRSSAQLIKRVYQNEPEKTIKYLGRIENGVTNMIQLLEDLLLLSESQSTDWPIKLEPVRLDTFIENIVEEVSLAYDHPSQITSRGNIDGQEFMIDRKLFRLIMNNLINNALKYSSHPERPIDIHSRVEKDVLTVCIADQGIGVPEHEITHLFEAFHRAGNVGTRQGTGLGLAIVKGAIDRLAGTINVASMENQGTTFTFTIPLATAANEVAC